jgi:DNA-binding transcriptional LysR family regulator
MLNKVVLFMVLLSHYPLQITYTTTVDEMNELGKMEDGEIEGVLRLSVPMSFGLSHLSPALEEFASLHPKLHLQIDFSDRQVDMIAEGLDLAFRISELEDSSMQARKIVPIKFALLASPEYLEQYGLPKHHDDLQNHLQLRYGSGSEDRWRLVDPAGRKVNIHLSGQMSANNGDFLCQMAINGHGLVMLPTFIAWRALQSRALVKVLPEYKITSVAAYAVYPQNRFLPKKSRVLIDFLVDYFKDNVYWDEK